MSDERPWLDVPHIVWVYPGSLAHALDSATWLETTRELRQLGWRVTLVAAGRPPSQCLRGVEVRCVRKPRIYLVRQAVFHLRVLRLLASEKVPPDVVFFNQMSALWLLPIRFIRRLRGRQRPLTVMDTRTLPMVMSARKDWLRALYYGLMNWLANHWADGQTAITQRMAEAVRIPPQQLWGVWPSGVNLDLFSPAQAARRWPLPGDSIHLIYTGALFRERNLVSLCRAVERANGEGMCFTLSLIGAGPEQPALEHLAQGSGGRIRVLPAVPYEQVPGWLAQAHIGVLPFPNKEKFRVSSPIKLFEYMGAGLPILATRLACHTDVARDGQYVFWAEEATEDGLYASLLSIWRRQGMLESMGGEAAIAAQEWTWRHSASKLSDALTRGLASAHS